MPIFNRENPEDAQKVVDKFITDESSKRSFLSFLIDAIDYANNLGPSNWNLNLDTKGKFIRFNVGQEYCIEIQPKKSYLNFITVLVLKDFIQQKLINQLNINFYRDDEINKIPTRDLESIPGALTKVPGSVACYIRFEDIEHTLPYLKEANRKFIDKAIANTRIHPASIKAHSSGFIAYISRYSERSVPNPAYMNLEDEFFQRKSKKENFYVNDIDNSELTQEIESNLIPEQINNPLMFFEGASQQIAVNSYERNPKARSKCIEYYGVKCIICGFDFKEKYGEIGRNFIHIHHEKPLGEIRREYQVDPINDLCPVCPNCHAMLHQRKPEPYTIQELVTIINSVKNQ